MSAIAINLPFPPSTNSIWRSRHHRGRVMVYRSKKYEAWQKNADAVYYTTDWRKVRRITGRFTAEIILDEKQRKLRDADNYTKAVLDWAQSRELIRNDRHADRVTCGWGVAPHGCKLLLTPVST